MVYLLSLVSRYKNKFLSGIKKIVLQSNRFRMISNMMRRQKYKQPISLPFANKVKCTCVARLIRNVLVPKCCGTHATIKSQLLVQINVKKDVREGGANRPLWMVKKLNFSKKVFTECRIKT
jgi:hypothetical protein